MRTKCLIVDDEPLARRLIQNHLGKLDNFEVVAECSDAMKAFDVMRIHKIDLMFIDVQMPQITGIEFLKSLKHPPQVIITTAYPDYAIEGFELDVVDYLLKPITFERFLKSVNKYLHYAVNEMPVNRAEIAIPEEACLYVKENKRVVRILISDILYIEGLSEYVKIHTHNKKIVTKASMSCMEEKLPGADFMRIHKSFIVSLKKIEAYTATSIELAGKELPVGRSFKNRVATVLQKDVITTN